ncbi:aminotransferase class I/II-fold pyridoxal phosphate-dependent enzyme [Streptantibioticus ferralitis]|uniref:Aminotransferase class I/II-fold pyridoxal phosphate-dependent enzyme n=1 Tax=Streptantibioticus ferralitis TaxID=236510 RepID=A0ABT5YV74_9ACTN|nr:aminotransferase class I/II-fold pyridoxal phosphate-dependent enzyme [Streptantibioticus ferralitis]MDF2255503.1 aminotransferase class I/II-fold pyridoxal phosphate-dependent enzyme [Streptantibioticus ferralitis]
MELSPRGAKMGGLSGIRSIMEDIALAASDPSGGTWLNLSPGNPAHIPEVTGTWLRLQQESLAQRFAEASGRYGPSRGSDGLVDAIVRYFNRRYDWDITAQNVLVGAGCQMLAFMATTIFTGPYADGPRRLVLPSVPDYTGYQGLSLDEGGIVGVAPGVELQEGRLFRYTFDLEAVGREPSMGMMLLSSPGNPTGRSIPADALAGLIEIAEERNVPLFLDHAYGDPFPGVAEDSVDPPLHSHVINCFTLSKAGLPGERLGFAIGPQAAIDAMLSFTANSYLHPPQLIQATAEQALNTGVIDTLTSEVIKPYYRRKRQVAEKLLHELLPDTVDWRLHATEGGMFCWLWIDHDWFDDLAMYEALKRKKVFIVPGRHFFVPPFNSLFLAEHATRCVRLSLSPDESVIAEGIRRLAEALEEMRGAH